jgi:hypothetical protein
MSLKTLRSRSLRSVVAVAVCLGLMQSAMAGYIECRWETFDWPGIDHYGHPDFAYHFPIKYKVVINHKNGWVIAIGSGKIHNHSGKRIVLKNFLGQHPYLLPLPVHVKHDRHVISRPKRKSYDSHLRSVVTAKLH